MKPTLQPFQTNFVRDGRESRIARGLPKIDRQFRANSISEFNGRCHGSPAPSFRRISEDYFNNEAPGHFVSEAAIFGLMLVTAAVPVIEGARGAVQFLRAIGVL